MNTDSPTQAPLAADVRSARDGDPRATEVLARRSCRLALRTAGAILHDRDAASDIAQDVAVDVLRSLRKLRDPRAFDAWVHKITVRHVLRATRRRSVARDAETPLALLTEADHPPAAEGTDQTTVLAARELLAVALSALPPKQRIALALRYVHDLSDAEIATALGCRPGTVHALLSRGRAALRRDAQLADLALAITGG